MISRVVDCNGQARCQERLRSLALNDESFGYDVAAAVEAR